MSKLIYPANSHLLEVTKPLAEKVYGLEGIGEGVKVAVRGGSGYLGGSLCFMLVQRGYKVRVVDIAKVNPYRETFPGIEYISGDISVESDMEKACSGMDRVICVVTPNPLTQSSIVLEKAIVIGTQTLVCVCERLDCVKSLVWCSSGSVVFDTKSVSGGDESMPYIDEKRGDKYSVSKSRGEHLALQANGPRLQTLAIRPHAIYGYNQVDRCGLDHQIIDEVHNRSLVVVGDGGNLSDFTHVLNAAWALVLAGEVLAGQVTAPCSPENLAGHVFNVSDDRPVRFWCFVSNLVGELNFPRPRIYLPYWLVLLVSRVLVLVKGSSAFLTPFKVRLLGLDHWYSIRRAKLELGYIPVLSHSEGFKDTVKYHLGNNEKVRARLEGVKDVSILTKGLFSSTDCDIRITATIGIVMCFMGWVMLQCLLAALGLSELWGFAPYFSSVTLFGMAGLLGVFLFILNIIKNAGTVPRLNSGIPIIGDFLKLSGGPISLLRRLHREACGPVSVSIFGKRVVYMSSQEDLEWMFKLKDTEVSLREVYNVVMPLFGKGVLYNTDLERRHTQLYHLAQTLSDKNLLLYTHQIQDECKMFFEERMKGNFGVLSDLSKDTANIITLIVARCLMGEDIRRKFYTRISELLLDMDEGITYLAVLFPYLPIERHRKRDAARKEMASIFDSVIQERLKLLNNSGVEMKHKLFVDDSLGELMSARYSDGTRFTADEICGMLILLTFAGQHTSSLSTTWFIAHVVSSDKRFLRRILKEQIAVKEWNYTAVKNLDVMSMGIHESLRLHGPLANLARYMTKEKTYKGHHFKPGIALGVCTYVNQLDSDTYDNPEEFLPDRWIHNDWYSWHKNFKTISFGCGRHSCMGQRFAMLLIKSITSYLITRYVFWLQSEFPKASECDMVVGPDRQISLGWRRIKPGEDLLVAWGVADIED